MADRPALPYSKQTTGDAVVDGLFGGILAGLAMAAYLLIVGVISGESPAIVLGRFSVRGEASPAIGALLHLAVCGIYGMLFGLIWQVVAWRWPAARFGWLAGLLYGFALWVIAATILLPRANSP